MTELVSLGIRLDKKMVSELNRIADEEHVDRTTVIRKLISGAIENYKKGMVLRKCEQGKISISKAGGSIVYEGIFSIFLTPLVMPVIFPPLMSGWSIL